MSLVIKDPHERDTRAWLRGLKLEVLPREEGLPCPDNPLRNGLLLCDVAAAITGRPVPEFVRNARELSAARSNMLAALSHLGLITLPAGVAREAFFAALRRSPSRRSGNRPRSRPRSAPRGYSRRSHGDGTTVFALQHPQQQQHSDTMSASDTSPRLFAVVDGAAASANSYAQRHARQVQHFGVSGRPAGVGLHAREAEAQLQAECREAAAQLGIDWAVLWIVELVLQGCQSATWGLLNHVRIHGGKHPPTTAGTGDANGSPHPAARYNTKGATAGSGNHGGSGGSAHSRTARDISPDPDMRAAHQQQQRRQQQQRQQQQLQPHADDRAARDVVPRSAAAGEGFGLDVVPQYKSFAAATAKPGWVTFLKTGLATASSINPAPAGAAPPVVAAAAYRDQSIPAGSAASACSQPQQQQRGSPSVAVRKQSHAEAAHRCITLLPLLPPPPPEPARPSWRPVQLPYNEPQLQRLEESLLMWLADLGLVTLQEMAQGYDSVTERLSRGVLLCDIVEAVTGRRVAGVYRPPRTTPAAESNIGKALEVLKTQAGMSRRYLQHEAALIHGERAAMTGLLEDLHRMADGCPPHPTTACTHPGGAAPAPYAPLGLPTLFRGAVGSRGDARGSSRRPGGRVAARYSASVSDDSPYAPSPERDTSPPRQQPHPRAQTAQPAAAAVAVDAAAVAIPGPAAPPVVTGPAEPVPPSRARGPSLVPSAKQRLALSTHKHRLRGSTAGGGSSASKPAAAARARSPFVQTSPGGDAEGRAPSQPRQQQGKRHVPTGEDKAAALAARITLRSGSAPRRAVAAEYSEATAAAGEVEARSLAGDARGRKEADTADDDARATAAGVQQRKQQQPTAAARSVMPEAYAAAIATAASRARQRLNLSAAAGRAREPLVLPRRRRGGSPARAPLLQRSASPAPEGPAEAGSYCAGERAENVTAAVEPPQRRQVLTVTSRGVHIGPGPGTPQQARATAIDLQPPRRARTPARDAAATTATGSYHVTHTVSPVLQYTQMPTTPTLQQQQQLQQLHDVQAWAQHSVRSERPAVTVARSPSPYDVANGAAGHDQQRSDSSPDRDDSPYRANRASPTIPSLHRFLAVPAHEKKLLDRVRLKDPAGQGQQQQWQQHHQQHAEWAGLEKPLPPPHHAMPSAEHDANGRSYGMPRKLIQLRGE